MADKYIETRNLAVGYNGKAIIKDICVSIEKGEIVTLIGPNGAGKSTILKSISRQLQLIDGAVILDGSDLCSFSGKALASKMAVVLTDRIRPDLLTCHVPSCRLPFHQAR